ncbi:carboxymuconolactone decarboxylase family protein [Deinococcus radiotolerans]|uniref:4-carboxymuconolactone decarboxylase n=1 Tax=Deinococcus radiotolerans TaxID=1309407 RepID=A0ABQ2FLZ1_9DEIO|nr:carboxymuconolactone decarboxylase family protein [Deinococcus radiotolerans]GGL05755.1 4-carboxymuconolactone decarboxylase [Deinococcus radiotolerans]
MKDDTAPRARDVIFGTQQPRIQQRLDDLDPDLGAYIRDFAYDTVYDRPALDLKVKELIACTLLVSLGSPPELRTHIRGALNAGATEAEVRDALMLCVPYLGFPRVVAAFEVLRHHLASKERPAPVTGAGPVDSGDQ